MINDLFSLASDFFLVQQIDAPTHCKGNQLDVVFTNNCHLVVHTEISPCPRSDHFLIDNYVASNSPRALVSSDEPPPPPEGFWKLNFFDEKVDWQSLTDALAAHPWNEEFANKSPDECLNGFISVSLHYSEKHVPPRTKAARPPTTSLFNRIPREQRCLLRKRCKFRKRYFTETNPIVKANLKKKLIANEKKIAECDTSRRNKREQQAISKIKCNPKFFFSYAKSLSKTKVGIGPLICNRTKTLIASPSKMAEILNEQYSSVFSNPRKDTAVFCDNDPACEISIEDIQFTDADILAAIKELTASSAAGPDGFPAILLKKCGTALSGPLAHILRRSLNDGKVPDVCKMANIIPIHKGKSRAAAKNYRPVALTSILSKIFEKVIRSHLASFLVENNLFNPTQHGFQASRSCLSQLLDHCDRVLSEMVQGHGVDVVYLDFAKAFDKVDHYITLNKLKALGISGRLFRWLESFLVGRTQRVLVEGQASTPSPVRSGVPQGSVLGPLLFLILIGDIDEKVASAFLSSFADDTRVGKGITVPADCELLQTDLNTVYEWSDLNNMEFNSEKFEVMRYRPPNSTLPSLDYTSYDGKVIEEKTSLRDLGVTLSNDCTFSAYITDQCCKVRGLIAWVMRTFETRHPVPMMTLWKSVIRCHLEYASQLWSPSRTGEIQQIEALQASFLRKISGLQSLTYWQRLARLKLYSLERRRERYAILYVWKILEGKAPNLTANPITPRHSNRLGRTCAIPPLPPASTPARLRSLSEAAFPVRGPQLFNALPRYLRDIANTEVDTFKRQLTRFLDTVPDEPRIPGLTSAGRIESNSIIDWTPWLRQQHAAGLSTGHDACSSEE